MAELPQWTAGQDVAGNWGGSSTAVMAASKHQQDAAEFAAWLNTTRRRPPRWRSVGGIYPADTAAEAALSAPPSYFSNQPRLLDPGQAVLSAQPRRSPGARTWTWPTPT